ncbi:MAG: hypothetical protein A3F72_17445 [Bacteroidetes bacterium RIFCSPLOWO2_12_FULL_35_15]|nr:MAG: hypothetical protein A3F72_17445 [Bacteroidetes bacterium RIFCSPLOWO2_12_FULL_35_15]
MAQAAWPNHFDYLTVPILLRATFGKRIKYFANAGMFFGYLIKQTIVYKILQQFMFLMLITQTFTNDLIRGLQLDLEC